MRERDMPAGTGCTLVQPYRPPGGKLKPAVGEIFHFSELKSDARGAIDTNAQGARNLRRIAAA
jgi:hypothetical protein